MSDKIKMLRGKLALATERPLRVSMSGYSIKSYDPDVPIVAAVHGGAAASPRQLEAWINNSDLFVEAVNHLDALVDIAEAAERLRIEKQKVNDAAKDGTLLATGALTAADEALFAALAKLAAIETP